MNKVKKKVYRNTQAFTLMPWASFSFYCALMLIGLYTLKEPPMVKGYYLIGCWVSIFFIYCCKSRSDNQEDDDLYAKLLQTDELG